MKPLDLTGQRFGRLTAIQRKKSQKGRSMWLCQCDCGNQKVVSSNHLTRGAVKSCGCLNKEIAHERGELSKIGERTRKHGDFGTKLYGVWAGIKRRCQNPNTKYYADYGGRGIRVCEDWQNYEPFKEWALSQGYHEGMSIERIDVDGDYSPENCKWIPLSEQNRNKRLTVYIEYQGKRYTVKEVAAITGLKERTIRARYERGWSSEQIFSTTSKHQEEKGR